MTLPRVLLGVLLRSVALVLVMAGYGSMIARSTTTDALGAGLLAFLILVVVVFVWAVVDGVRGGFAHPMLMWLLSSVAGGIGIPVALALTVSDESINHEIRDGAVFFGILLLLPAILGLAIGGIVHRLRSHSRTADPEPALVSAP